MMKLDAKNILNTKVTR